MMHVIYCNEPNHQFSEKIQREIFQWRDLRPSIA